MRLHWLILVVHILCLGLCGQTPQSPAAAVSKPVPAPVVTPAPPIPPGLPPDTIVSTEYPLPPEVHSKIRDWQYEIDQLEIENQKMQVRIEQNKARQGQLTDLMKGAAFDYAQSKKIDIDSNELDAVGLKFRPKKKAPVPAVAK